MNREISNECRALVASFEGLSLTAYMCPAGVWTIGNGHTAGVRPGDKITATQAETMLLADLVAYGHQIEIDIGPAATSRHQYEAMLSLAFNIGLGGFKSSSVLRLHKAGDTAGAARLFGLWNKATVNGQLQELPGLTRRRASEMAYYLTPDIPPIKSMPQAVEAPKSPVTSKTILGTATATVGATSIIVENVQPTIDAINYTANTVSQAKSAWAGIKDALDIFQNGNVLTFAIMVAVVGVLIYVGLRYWRKTRNGEAVST